MREIIPQIYKKKECYTCADCTSILPPVSFLFKCNHETFTTNDKTDFKNNGVVLKYSTVFTSNMNMFNLLYVVSMFYIIE